MDFIHTDSGSEVDEIPSFEPQVIDSKERLPRKPSPLRLLPTEHNFEEIIGESPALKRTLKQVEIVAPTDSTVLLLGDRHGQGADCPRDPQSEFPPRTDFGESKLRGHTDRPA